MDPHSMDPASTSNLGATVSPRLRRPNRWRASLGQTLFALAMSIFAQACGAPPQEPAVTLPKLLDQMTNPLELARFPEPFFRGFLASSTDRSATTPTQTDTWFKNVDLGNYARVETREGRDEHVLLDVTGPGTVTRIWSANPSGTLRIYIDGQAHPALEANMESLLSGKVRPFVAPFAYTAARGKNLYFPFPFAKSCKITMDAGGAFYQVNYRLYTPGTRVEPYSPQDLEAHAALIAATGAMLADGPAPAGPETRTLRFTGSARLEGSRVLRSLRLSPPDIRPEALRKLTLVIEADGTETIRVPLGDFFGTGPGLRAYDSMMASVSSDGTLNARWPMPFRKSFSVRAEGPGADAIPGVLTHEAWTWNDRSLYFHAAWQSVHDIPSWPPRDWMLVSIKGRGVYVGTLFQITNASKGWWGEGDEKIWVDNETFPSHFGTGTEDYFGYAWSTPERFARPYHGQTRADGPGGYGHFSMYRWHILDPIPFQSSLRFDQELWHWMRKTTVSLSGISYFYAPLDTKHSGLRVDPDSYRVPSLAPLPTKLLGNAIEGEDMRFGATGGEVEPERMVRYLVSLWSQDQQLRWRGPKVGDRLTLEFDAPQEGRFALIGHFTQAQDYGIHQLSVNGEPVGPPRDFWGHVVAAQEDIDLGQHALRQHGNTLTIEVVGANPRVRDGRYDFGIDALQLVPEPQ